MLITDREQLKEYSSEYRIWQGIPGIEVTKKGRIFCSFYSGETDEELGNYCVLVKSDDGGKFTEPIAVVYESGYRCFDPCVWIDPLDRLWLVWAVTPQRGCYGVICENPEADDLMWGEEFFIGHDVMLNKPTVLSTGEWLFPLAVWNPLQIKFPPLYYSSDAKVGAFVYKTVDHGKSFENIGGIAMPDSQFDEHMVLEMADGVLKMFIRTKYGIGVSCSYDRGYTWTEGENSGLENPVSRFFIRRLKSGRILMINHLSSEKRTNLAALLSEDEGKTWKYQLMLDDRENVSYPDAVEAEDGYIYIIYDRERGNRRCSMTEVYSCAREILYAKISEKDIIAGKFVDKKSKMRRCISKLGKYAGDESKVFNTVEKMSDIELANELMWKYPTELVDKVFEYYPLNCVNVRYLDNDKLDELIELLENGKGNKMSILVEIISHIRAASYIIGESIPLVERVKEIILANMHEDLSVSEIAKKVGMSVYYMQHQFKLCTRLTITDYKNALKLFYAKNELVYSKKSVTDIAYDCGFGSSSYFSEVFMKYERVSPTEYRNLLGVNNNKCDG